jgi:hypothetical protein
MTITIHIEWVYVILLLYTYLGHSDNFFRGQCLHGILHTPDTLRLKKKTRKSSTSLPLSLSPSLTLSYLYVQLEREERFYSGRLLGSVSVNG